MWRNRWWRALILSALLSGIIAAVSPVGAAAALALSPDHAPCSGTITISGTGLPPSQVLGLTARATKPASSAGIQFATPATDASGHFTIDTAVNKMIPGCVGGAIPPDGTEFTIYLTSDPGAGASTQGLAMAVFTVGGTPSGSTPGLPNTGGGAAAQSLGGWQALGLGLLLPALLAGGVWWRRRTEERARAAL
jgi:hypothetical protein